MPTRPSFVSAVLVVSVLGISLSGPLVRLSAAAPIAIAVWRLAFSLIIVAVPLVVGGGWREWRALDRRDWTLTMGAGVLLALHFWSWNTSITMTTIAASVLLVNTQPLVVGAFSTLWLRESPSRPQWLGIAIAMAGALVVAWPDLARGGATDRAALGDALAIIGAITAAGYYVIGRRARSTLSLWAYVALVYGACLVTLIAIAVVTNTALGPYAPREYGIFALLALGPMLLGHTGLNWALRYARAYQVNIVLLGEPIGASVLAALLPGIRETPTVFTVAGAVLVLGGILLAERRLRAPPSAPPKQP